MHIHIVKRLSENPIRDPSPYQRRYKSSGGGANVVGIVTDQGVEDTDDDLLGIIWVEMRVIESPCDQTDLLGTTIRVYDRFEAVLDEADLTGFAVWASQRKAYTLDETQTCPAYTSCYWSADNRSCSAVNPIERLC